LRLRRLTAGATALTLTLAACTTPLPPPGPVATSLAVVVADNNWHTDVCVRGEDAGPFLLGMLRGFDGARYLCFGFGDKQFMVEHDHSVLTMVSAMLPSQAAVVMTPVRGGPELLYGAENAVIVGISRAGADGLVAFIRASVQTDAAGAPVSLGTGVPDGRIYYAATASYYGLNTCNTWTGTALRTAGVPVDDGALFASDVMRQVRPYAASQAKPP